MSDKAKDLLSGMKKMLKSPPSLAGRRSSSGSFSISGAFASFSLSNTPSTTSNDSITGGRTSSLNAKGYADADLAAAAAAAADEMFNEGKGSGKKERRSSFSFASWKEKHRAKKTAQQAQKEAEKVSVKYGATAATPRGTPKNGSRAGEYGRSNSLSYSQSPAHALQSTPKPQRSMSSRTVESSGHAPPMHLQRSVSGRPLEPTPEDNQATAAANAQTNAARARSNTATTARPNNQLSREGSARSRAASSAVTQPQPPLSSSNSYSFSARQQEKTRTTNRASTMIVDDVATIVKPRRSNRVTVASHWGDSDTDEDGDSYEDSRAPRTRGFSRRSVSMDFMEPQQPTHLISKIWRKLPIQARLYGRGSIDLDLEKDRTSVTRASATKMLRKGDSGDEYNIPSSPLPDESNVFGDKHIRFSHKIAYTPSEGVYIGLESYDDVLVRVCQFASHDQRRTAVKVAEFLERSMAFVRGTTTKRGQKVSISNEEIRMWRRLARHDWREEEITTMDGVAPTTGNNTANGRSHSSSSITEEETDDDEVVVTIDMEKMEKLCEVINCCLNAGDSLFRSDDIEELVTLELLVEEDGWI